MALTVGIDASRLRGGSTGVGRYTLMLLAPLDAAMPDASFILFARKEHDVELPSPRWTVVCDTHPVWSKLPVTFWAHYRLGYLLKQTHVDVFWAANSFIPGAGKHSVPCVATVFDLRHLLYPRDMPPITRLAHKFWFASSLRLARQVVAISQGTSDRMLSSFGRGADVVIQPSVPRLPTITNEDELCQTLEAAGVRRPFLMTVGNSPCKNLQTVVAALTMLKRGGILPEHQLVMVGPRSGRALTARATARDASWVRKLGRVTDVTLSALYRTADALIFPSIYEGFGIPVVEARAAGCRVVTTDSPELREAGGNGAVYVKPTRDGIAAGIEEVLSLPRPQPLPATAAAARDLAGPAMARVLRSAAKPAK